MNINLDKDEMKTMFDSLLSDCPLARASVIKEKIEFIREDIPLEDWNFSYGLYYDDRIEIWHTPTKLYKQLFQFV